MQEKQTALQGADETEDRIFFTDEEFRVIKCAIENDALVDEEDDWDPVSDGGYSQEEVDDIDSDVPFTKYQFVRVQFYETVRKEEHGHSISLDGLSLLIEMLQTQTDHGYYTLVDLQDRVTCGFLLEDEMDDLEDAYQALCTVLANPSVRRYARYLSRAAIERSLKKSHL